MPRSTGVSCFGGADGTVTASATGGSAPYSFKLDGGNSQSSGAFGNVAAGSHTVTVQDANHCTAIANVTVAGPSASLSASISAQSSATCPGCNDGTATVNASGGTPGYSYRWDNGQTSAQATGLAPGGYTVKVTDGNGCTTSMDVTIGGPSAVASRTSSNPSGIRLMQLGLGSEDTSDRARSEECGYERCGEKRAVAAKSPAGDEWTENSLIDSEGEPTIVTLNVDDETAVTAGPTIPSEPTLTARISEHANVSCFAGEDGTATVSVSGGSPGYRYSWDTNPVQKSPRATGLGVGAYTATVTDANGYAATTTVTIAGPAVGLAVRISDQHNVSCFGSVDGSATVSVDWRNFGLQLQLEYDPGPDIAERDGFDGG